MQPKVQPGTYPSLNLRKPLAVSATLIGYSNALAALAYARGWSTELTFRYINPVSLLLLVPYTAKQEGGLKGAGLHKEGMAASAAWGVPVGLGLAAVSIFFFANPFISDAPLNYKPITDMSQGELLLDVLVRVPVSIAFFEELAFRGLLYGMLKRRTSA